MTVGQGMLFSGVVCFFPALFYFRLKRFSVFAHTIVPLVVALILYWRLSGSAGVSIILFFISGMAGSILGEKFSLQVRERFVRLPGGKDFSSADTTETAKVAAAKIDKLLEYPPKPEERPPEERGLVIETRYTRFLSFCKGLLAFCASLFVGLFGAWLWSVVVAATGLDYLKWSSLFLILVAAGVGYIIHLPAKRASFARGVIAAIIALVAICTGKVLVGRNVILPGIESHLRNGVVTVRNIEPLVNSPRWMFVITCKYSADKYDWDKSLTRQVIRDYLLSGIFGRSLPYTPNPKVVSAIQQINETIAASTDSHKRLMAKAVVNSYRDTTDKPSSLKDASIFTVTQIKSLVVYGLAAELLAGQEAPSLRMFEYLIALISSFYWFDLIIFPACLWVAYRINS